jgi:DNA-directed RNA polymerase specialized sigma subunit
MSNKYYFSTEHENAVIEYCSTTDRRVKQVLYEVYIAPAFNEMVDKIIYTYKFTNLPNIENLREECKFWLMTILEKYDPSKGYKAFSYFSVITKNWFIHKVKKNNKNLTHEISYEQSSNEIESQHQIVNDYHERQEQEQFWNDLLKDIDTWGSSLKEQDLKILESVKQILHNKENIEIFNKKAIYIYMKEITGLNSKQITSSLNKIRIKYVEFKRGWEEQE